MNVVDSSGWIAWFRNERNAGLFGEPILDVDRLIVPSIALTEVFRFLGRNLGEAHALEAVAQMSKGRVVPLDAGLAITAAEIGLGLALPLADSVIYATARRFDALVWTQDSDFKNLPGVKFLAQ